MQEGTGERLNGWMSRRNYGRDRADGLWECLRGGEENWGCENPAKVNNVMQKVLFWGAYGQCNRDISAKLSTISNVFGHFRCFG